MKKLYNHLSSKLSDLDLEMISAVPPGGNWKDIPESIPSRRLSQIRESYLQGKGSRSTYYGRLRKDKPSYTINTYFNRPGNGCHVHYEQDRVLSQREAARLQSFPDSFVFKNTMTSINTQIGNAVPPLLAFQIAKKIEESIGQKGFYVDLFSGAGGLGYGFKMAGWTPIVANDIEGKFLETYASNVHDNTIVGSISNKEVFSRVTTFVKDWKKDHANCPLWILGGPPCQGFSTAGNKRSMDDDRNLLFYSYRDFLSEVCPDGFLFENVSGLLNMEKGHVFELVKKEFLSVMPNITGWLLNSEQYAVPQRRKRVFLVGFKDSNATISPLEVLTDEDHWVSVYDAISDLPRVEPGDYQTEREYSSIPITPYQNLMTGIISFDEYLSIVKKNNLPTNQTLFLDL